MKHSGKKLREEVFKIIQKEWPIHVSLVCRKLQAKTHLSNISKLRYHFNELQKEGKIHTKKLDRALVAWPVEIEKLRVMRDFLSE